MYRHNRRQCLPPSKTTALKIQICVYIGGNNKARLKGWAYWLLREGYTQKIVCSRVAKRMTGWKHELKLKPMACDRIQELAAIYQELREAPISDKPSRPPKVEPLHPIHKWQRGDLRCSPPDASVILGNLPRTQGLMVKRKARKLIRWTPRLNSHSRLPTD